MERSLLWGAFGIGCLGTLCALVLARGRLARGAKADSTALPFALVSGLLPLLVFGLTLPTKPPFADGQALGRGFLLGGLAALLASSLVAHALRPRDEAEADGRDGLRTGAAVTGPLFVALVAAAIPLLALRASLLDALMGTALGWFSVVLVQIVGQGRRPQSGRAAVLCLGLATGFLLTLCLGEALCELRGRVEFAGANGPVSWSAVVLAFAAFVPIWLLTGSFAARLVPAGGRTAARLLVGMALLLLTAWAFQGRLPASAAPLGLVAVGLAAALSAWALLTSGGSKHGNGSGALGMPALVMAAASMAAFQWLPGIGLVWLLLAGWLVAGSLLAESILPKMPPPDTARSAVPPPREIHVQTLVCLLLFQTILLAYWLFTKRFASELSGVVLTDHYALFGFLLGVSLPPMLTGYVSRQWASRPVAVLITRLAAAGAVCLLLPAAVLGLFGAKCALCLFFGLALAALLPASSALGGASLGNALFACGIALALAQWTQHVLPFALLSRAVKIKIIAEAFAALIAFVALAELGQRLLGRNHDGQNETDSIGEGAL